MQYLEMFIEAVMDSLEEFFDALQVPTAKYIRDAFLVSLVFLGGSIVCEGFNVWTFVEWEEAATCSAILLFVTLIDSATRHSVKSMAKSMKSIAAKSMSRFAYSGEEQEQEQLEIPYMQDAYNEEVQTDNGE